MTDEKTWQDYVDEAIREGGVVHQPNGLPIRCIKHDNTLWEDEHADHPDYMFPVQITYTGELSPEVLAEYRYLWKEPKLSDEVLRNAIGDVHALIYTDGIIAVTLYECRYDIWLARSGKCVHSARGDSKSYRLAKSAIEAIRKLGKSDAR